jgi:hypothetical protein
MPDATVVSGVRGIESVVHSPSESELPRAFAVAKGELIARPLEVGEKLFVSPSRNFRQQITSPKKRLDPGTGEDITPDAIQAKFEHYLFRTGDEFIIGKMLKSRAFGIEFYDAEVEVLRQSKAITARLLAKVKEYATPEMADEIIDQLRPLAVAKGKTSVDLPVRETGRGGSKAKA